MYENEKLIEELNDLKMINNERIEKYEKELEKTEDSEFISLFNRMIKESIQYNEELDTKIKMKGLSRNPVKIPGRGDIYKNWKSSIASEDKNNFGENKVIGAATLKAYENALSSDIYIPSHIASLIVMQKAKLKESFQLLLKKQNLILENS